MEAALILSRLAQFAAAFILFGGASFRLYGFGGNPAARETGALAAFEAWFARVAIVGALVALLSAVTMLAAVSGTMGGSPAAMLHPGTIGAVLFSTEFGRVWIWHLLATVLLILAAIVPQARWRWRAVFALALFVVASLAWVGHAVMDRGALRIVHQLNDTVHLLAGGLWLGGLVPLAWFLGKLRRAPDPIWLTLGRAVLARFSQMGYGAVALLAVTGIINALLLVGSPSALVGTPYGRLLSLKILLFLAMLGLALVNRFRLLPWLATAPHSAGPLAALARSVVAEQALGIVILAVVSVLGTWPPAIHAGHM